MDVIHQLPDSVANMIAAGEVVERPASVVKELVENAIDAGAKHIQVLIRDGGKTSIQVIDDGCGMSETDARLAFEKHATSKIRNANDLFDLSTMGFRGEALAAVAAVAQVTLKTRREEDEIGTKVVIGGSKFVSQEPEACAKGTNFLIENLFYTITARRNFLKPAKTEFNKILEVFHRIVLIYPDIEFTLYDNDMLAMQLRATNLNQRISDVFNKKIGQKLLHFETNTTLCDIKGYIGKPEFATKKAGPQFMFVNGRYIKHPYFHHALIAGYDRLLPEGEHIPYFIYFTVEPKDIDINISPTKTDVKFTNDQEIYTILMSTVRNTIGRSDLLEFDTEGKPEDIPVYNQNPNATHYSQPKEEYNREYNPFRKEKADSGNSGRGHIRSAMGWESLFEGTGVGEPKRETYRQSSLNFDFPVDPLDSTVPTDDYIPDMGMTDTSETNNMDRSKDHYQLNGRFILTQTSKGLMVTDQHRASIRILYERYKRGLQEHSTATQTELFHEIVQFPPSYLGSMDVILENLNSFGFEITDLGGGNYNVSGIPAGLEGLNAISLINDLVSEAVESGNGVANRVNEILALGLARKAATPYGEFLTNETMESIISQLLECNTHKYTPDGKLIINFIENDLFEQRFD